MRVVGPIYSGAAAGGAGVATANATTTNVVAGLVHAVYLQYLDSPPAGTCDVTVATAGVAHPAVTILAITNAATDGWFLPRAATHSTAGAAALYAAAGTAGNDLLPIADLVKVTIAQANAGDGVNVWLLVK